ncbi:MAG: type II toxin-antitoxin system RelE/ParE family toxin [Candidatus Sulfotelmatobacter sp.]
MSLRLLQGQGGDFDFQVEFLRNVPCMVQYPNDGNPEPSANRYRNADSAEKDGKRVPAIFFRTEAGGEPVREWLRSLSPDDRKRIGEDIKSVEYGWPVGMPVCRPLGNGIYEVRTIVTQGRIARVLFYVDKRSRMVLLHGFIKKTQKTPNDDLALARSNKSKHQRGVE